MRDQRFEVRIASLDSMQLHEHVEMRRVEALLERFREDRLLKNPPIACANDHGFIVLDGATRVVALKLVGCRDVVVQLINYDSADIVLESWNHAVVGVPAPQLIRALQAIPELRLDYLTAGDAERALAQRESISTILLPDGRAISLSSKNKHIEKRVALLNQIVGSYAKFGTFCRVEHTDLERLMAEHAALSALLVFPRFQPGEIQYLASQGIRLPTGVTRHIIAWRILHIDIPFDKLESNEALTQKQIWLDEWIRIRMQNNRIRSYQESVIVFDN
jgi:L-serine kinase (ATP) / ParB family transcriptional regulator, heme-responsive regulator